MPADVLATAGLSMLAREATQRKAKTGKAKADEKSVLLVPTYDAGGRNSSALHADEKDVEKERV
jgi:hypothetical protein